MHSPVAHDWTAYNRWVDQVSDGVGRSKPPQTIPTDWWTFAKALALCVLALGIALAVVLWAWRDPKVVVPEIEVDVHQPHGVTPLPPAIAKPAEVSPDSGKVVRNFVLFTERTVPGVGEVVTGWKFDNEGNARPVEQWCYLAPLYGAEVGAMLRFDLPRFNAATTSAAVLRRHRLTADELEKARRSCVWFQG